MIRAIPLSMLILVGLLLAPLPEASAVEEIEAAIPEGSRRGIADYQRESRRALEKLTGLVNLTSEGEKEVGAQWQRECNQALKMLERLEKQGHIPEEGDLRDWYDEEVQAWENVHEIGGSMLDLHYQMASTLQLIRDDIEVSQGFKDNWEDRLSTASGTAGDAKRSLDRANRNANDPGELKDALGDFSKVLNGLKDRCETLTRLRNTFRSKAFKFIDKNDLRGEYRSNLNKLKSKELDPDGSGLFYESEVEWEEVMYKTYKEYVAAVERWREINSLLHKDHIKKVFQSEGTKLLRLAGSSLLGVPMPKLTANHMDDGLGQWCLDVKDKAREAWRKVRSSEEQKLAHAIDQAELQIDLARGTYEETLDKLADEARDKRQKEELKIEKEIGKLAKKVKKKTKKLKKTHVDTSKYRKLQDEIEELQDEIEAKHREIEKLRIYWEETWLEKQSNAAFEKMLKTIKEQHEIIEKREEELEALDE